MKIYVQFNLGKNLNIPNNFGNFLTGNVIRTYNP